MSCVILITAHKSALTEAEEYSLVQCRKVLARHPVFLVCPMGLNTSCYRSVWPELLVDFIPSYWQKTYEHFNKMKIDPFLYERYDAYDYVLFYELDALVFSDELDYWCEVGFDYIGAPWFMRGTENRFEGVGNGGFSLRRIAAMLRVSRSFRSDFCGPEDVFWGRIVPSRYSWFKIAPPEVAVRFSFEARPEVLYALNNSRLPFGCHAWEKWGVDFYLNFLPDLPLCGPKHTERS